MNNFQKNKNNSKKYIKITISIILIMLALISAIPSSAIVAKRIVFGNSESVRARVERVNWTINKMKYFAKSDLTKFLTGNSLRTSSADFIKDFPSPEWWAPYQGKVFALDSEYLVILYETGILGFLLFCFAWLFLLFSKTYRSNSPAWWLLLSYIVVFIGLEFLQYSGINIILVFLLALFSDRDNYDNNPLNLPE